MDNLLNALRNLLRTGSTNTPLTGTNMVNYRRSLKDLKLEVLLFTHFMYEDDDKLSVFEKASIVKMIKEECESVPESVEDLFKEWLNNPPSLGYILDYAKENEYQYEDLDDAIRQFVYHTDSNSKYHPIIRNVRKKLLLEKEYLKK